MEAKEFPIRFNGVARVEIVLQLWFLMSKTHMYLELGAII